MKPRLSVVTIPTPQADRWPRLSVAVPRLAALIKVEAGRLGALERNPTPASVEVALRALSEIEGLCARLKRELSQ
jgi:hypothetical protein